MANFMQTMRPCPFGFYDSDPAFQVDADKMIVFVLRKLGEDVLSVELTKKQIWACFEEATLAFNALMIEYQAKSNLTSLLGSPTGSLNNETNFSQINLTNTYVRPTLEFLVRQAEPYAAEVGYGGITDTFSGSIALVEGRQDYDLYTELVDEAGTPLASLMPDGSSGKMKVHDVFHEAPAQFVFNSNMGINFAGFTGPGEGYAGVANATFYVLPLFEDVLRSGMLEHAARVRRSHYSYRLSGRNIRIFPMPARLIPGLNDRLWIRISYPQSAAASLQYNQALTSSLASGSLNVMQTLPDSTIFGVSNPGNVPYGLIDYKSLNPWARYWIFEFTLALAKELLGLTRSKMKNIPIPSGDLQLNGEDLITQAREDKEKLLEGDGGLRGRLEALTYDKLAEINALKAENEMKQMRMLPMPPSWIIKMG
jgi:hypothetical protein